MKPVRSTRDYLGLRVLIMACVVLVLSGVFCAPSFAQWRLRAESTESNAAEAADWTGCLSRALATVARISPARIRFCGRITDNAVGLVEALLQEDDRVLEITSLGGELDAPIRFAEIILNRGLNVEIIGPCLSGCASYVFVAAANRRVRERGWLGLHNTNTSATFLARRASGRDLAADSAPLWLRAEREQSLYAARGVSMLLLLDPQARIGTECIIATGRNEQTGETEYQIASRAGFWVPTRGQWRSYGVSFEGYAPRSFREATRIAQATLPQSAGEVLVIEYSSESLPQEAEVILSSIAWCDPGTVPN